MTLGDFRKITENYPDECSLQIRAENGYGGSTSDVVTRVIITTVDAVATALARLAGHFMRRGVSECRKSASIIARSA